METPSDDKPQDFYAAIGRALTVWSAVENELCTLFCRCVGPENAFPTHRAFWSVPSFEAKLRLVHSVMDARFGKENEIGKRWIDCRDELASLNRWRNKIAHGTLVSMPYIDKSKKKEVNDIFFAPYFWGTLGQKAEPNARDMRPSDRMYRKDIEDRCQQFSKLRDQAEELARTVFEAVFGAKSKGENLAVGPTEWHEGSDAEGKQV